MAGLYIQQSKTSYQVGPTLRSTVNSYTRDALSTEETASGIFYLFAREMAKRKKSLASVSPLTVFGGRLIKARENYLILPIAVF